MNEIIKNNQIIPTKFPKEWTERLHHLPKWFQIITNNDWNFIMFQKGGLDMSLLFSEFIGYCQSLGYEVDSCPRGGGGYGNCEVVYDFKLQKVRPGFKRMIEIEEKIKKELICQNSEILKLVK